VQEKWQHDKCIKTYEHLSCTIHLSQYSDTDTGILYKCDKITNAYCTLLLLLLLSLLLLVLVLVLSILQVIYIREYA